MITLLVSKVPEGLRGHLTKWLMEVAPGVFVGKVSTRVRDELWQITADGLEGGTALMVLAAANEQGFEVRNTPDKRIAYSVGGFVRVSDDRGATWQTRELELPKVALIQSYRDDRAFLRLDNRTILLATYGKPVARVRFYETWMLRSEDGCSTTRQQ